MHILHISLYLWLPWSIFLILSNIHTVILKAWWLTGYLLYWKTNSLQLMPSIFYSHVRHLFKISWLPMNFMKAGRNHSNGLHDFWAFEIGKKIRYRLPEVKVNNPSYGWMMQQSDVILATSVGQCLQFPQKQHIKLSYKKNPLLSVFFNYNFWILHPVWDFSALINTNATITLLVWKS